MPLHYPYLQSLYHAPALPIIQRHFFDKIGSTYYLQANLEKARRFFFIYDL